MSTRILLAICPILMLAASAQAVDVELTSPQEGSIIHPGDLVEMTLEVTNDTLDKDIIFVSFSMEITVDGQPAGVAQSRPLRFKLEAGESDSVTVAAMIPEQMPGMPFPWSVIEVTIVAEGEGKKSKTTDSDSITLVAEPA